MTQLFLMEGKWYKGNLHTHTNNSDGVLPPAQMAEQYRAAGYDFLCITDHNKVTDVSGLSNTNFLVIPGVEYGVGSTSIGQPYHLVVVNLSQPLDYRGRNAQQLIDLAKESGAEVIIAHPYWSALTINDMLALEGYIGIEVFNTSCHYSIAKGYSAIHWDNLLIRGILSFGFATDDAHWHFNEHRPNDACGAWIMVKSPSLTVKDLMQAIRKGNFYASNGPRIESIVVENDTMVVETSPAKVINFIADTYKGESFTAVDMELISHAEYKLRRQEKYVRIECIDEKGKIAWSNPIFMT